MIIDRDKEKLKERIDQHLRRTARQLITFDTVEETLNYLLESFYQEFTCDLVGVLLKEDDMLIPKVWIGDDFQIEQTLVLHLEDCASNLLEDALWDSQHRQQDDQCAFVEGLKKESLSTWFTVPLKYNEKEFGLCVIGFKDFVPLIIEAELIFKEFGRDVAIALDLAHEKERQKRKIKGIEWIKDSNFTGASIENIIEKIVKRAGVGTKAKGACVYLYDEINNYFTLTPPVYGSIHLDEKIFINSKKTIVDYFPRVEETGGHELTVPLIVNFKTIGMMYICHEIGETFTDEDLEFIKFVSTFVSMQIENARLYQSEYESKRRLEKTLEFHQDLVKKSVQGKDLRTLTRMISSMLECSVLLYDRFLRPITLNFIDEEPHLGALYEDSIYRNRGTIKKLYDKELWVKEEVSYSVWPIVGVKDILGYLVVCLEPNKIDRILRLTLDYSINVYAIEFIKQKLVMDAREQEKESFVNQLFSETVDDLEKVIKYATLINWDISEPHQVAVLSLEINQSNEKAESSIAIEGYKSWLWDQIKTELSLHCPQLIFTRKGDEFILIGKKLEEKTEQSYWKKIYKLIKKTVQKDQFEVSASLGIGDLTETINDYYYSYVKAVKAKNVVNHRSIGEGYAFYDDLGSYTILSNTSDPLAAALFVKKHLGPLIDYSKNNNVDLFNTLQVFLQNNGNYREASEELFIHRSTLEYRIERVAEILNININEAEIRFELMMAYRLYSLFDLNNSELLGK